MCLCDDYDMRAYTAYQSPVMAWCPIYGFKVSALSGGTEDTHNLKVQETKP